MTTSTTARVYDELLVTLVRAGNRPAGERLAARWHPRLLRTARRLLRDADQANEAVQDTWLAIAKGLWRLSDPAKFPAWAFGILHRKCADRIKQAQRRRAQFPSSDADIDLSAGHEAPRAEDAVALGQAMAGLSPAHRLAAHLYFAEGLTLAEIASATGVPVGTAKSRLFHARQQLKAALSGEKYD